MASIVWTQPAISDLNEIAEYISFDSIKSARSLVRKVFNSVERLEKFPNSGRKPPELKKSQYREIVVGPCRIFYRSTKKDVIIVYVMRSERELRNYILESRNI